MKSEILVRRGDQLRFDPGEIPDARIDIEAAARRGAARQIHVGPAVTLFGGPQPGEETAERLADGRLQRGETLA